MKETNCPYVKISDKPANEILLYSDNSNQTDFFNNFSIVEKAEAQSAYPQNILTTAQTLSDQLTFPFLILIFSFFIFIFLMSFVYYYHWKKFTMSDQFINGFVPIYFLGLVLLSVPLIYNLFF